jgi:hypothetical protein
MIMSSARLSPMSRGSRTVPPSMSGHAPALAENAEHRVLLGRPQVAPERELKPASDRVPRDRGDHRLGQPHPGGTYRPVAVRLGPVAVWHMTMSGKIIE